MVKTYIYGLFCNSNNIIRYVGKSNNPEKRLKQHLKSCEKRKTHKDNWILKNNYDINYIILEIVDIDNWQESEKYWIDKLKVSNNLTNNYTGGLGGSTIKYDLSYVEAKEIVSKFKLKTVNEWQNYISTNIIPDCLPRSPYDVYKNRGWKSWSDFLNSENLSDNKKVLNYLSYDEAKIWVNKNIKITNTKDWIKYTKSEDFPIFLPKKPDRWYKNKGWISKNAFFNDCKISNNKRVFLSYNECKKYINNELSQIKKCVDYREYVRDNEIPLFIPSNPDKTYKNNGWMGWKHFLN